MCGQIDFDAAIAELAARQHGVVARRQLLLLGLSEDAIDWRLRRGRLHRIHPGVYAVGHLVMSQRGRWMAAVLACGPGAVLSHRSAAALWGLRRYSGAIEVTQPAARHERPGLVARRSSIDPDEITELDGIPVTSIARTLLDLGQVLTDHQLEKALREAEYLRLLDLKAIEVLLERHPRRPGTPTLRRAFAGANDGAGRTRSDLEDLFTPLLVAAGLPRPELNVDLVLDATTTFQPDCLWRDQRLIAELDSRQAHMTRSRFESDRARDRRLQARGYRVIRITWRQLEQDAEAVIADLRALLGA